MSQFIVPPVGIPIVAGQPLPEAWIRFFQQVAKAATSAQNAANADDAVINTRRVNAGAGLSGGGDLEADVTIRQYVMTDVVANLPTSAGLGAWSYATNGRKSGEGSGAGTGVPVWWDGTAWFAAWSSAAVTA